MGKTLNRIVFGLLLLALLVAAAAYYLVFTDNVKAGQKQWFYIKSDENYEDFSAHLDTLLINPVGFHLLAERLNLKEHLTPGKYALNPEMSNLQLLRMFRSGRWENVVIKIRASMSRDSVMNYLAHNLEFSRADLDSALERELRTDSVFNRENIYCIFLPDHYFFNWAGSAQSAIKRFKKEYDTYWNAGRRAQADSLGLSREEVCILASIVDGEAIHDSELPVIAGLYLNRLNIKKVLQADPTILFIVGREGRQRVLNEDLKSDSPYNTYKYKGLPPGPILLPDKRAIEAVLHPARHSYLFMCARDDGSYYHHFTDSYSEHLINAAKYRRSLNRRGVMN